MARITPLVCLVALGAWLLLLNQGDAIAAEPPEPVTYEPAQSLWQASGAVAAESLGVLRGPQDGVKLDPNQIRYGKASDFDPKRGDKVGTVRSKDVYNEIPAYQTIIKERVEEGSARWYKLMREATEAYRAALQKAATSGTTYVLIVEEGGITGYPTADLTADIIKAL